MYHNRRNILEADIVFLGRTRDLLLKSMDSVSVRISSKSSIKFGPDVIRVMLDDIKKRWDQAFDELDEITKA